MWLVAVYTISIAWNCRSRELNPYFWSFLCGGLKRTQNFYLRLEIAVSSANLVPVYHTTWPHSANGCGLNTAIGTSGKRIASGCRF
jgi:hypothetical protein